MNTYDNYKKIVAVKNSERKETVYEIIKALEIDDEKTVDRLTLKMSIRAIKATDTGFSVHDLKTFLTANERSLRDHQKNADFYRAELRKINTKIAKSNGIAIHRNDKIDQKDNHFWLRIYTQKVNVRTRLSIILNDQLKLRNYRVTEPVYQNNHKTVNA